MRMKIVEELKIGVLRIACIRLFIPIAFNPI